MKPKVQTAKLMVDVNNFNESVLVRICQLASARQSC